MANQSVVSLKTIANEAKLSIATVSRILRGKDQCSAQTRQRVSEAAARLGYRPNLLVKGIQTGRTGTIGVLAGIIDEFFASIAMGIQEGLAESQSVPIFLMSDFKTDRPTSIDELTQLHQLIDRRVDGIILQPRQDQVNDDYLQEVWDRKIPLVTIDRELVATHADFVGTDDELGAKLAATHLLELGHRRLGHLAGRPDFVTTGRIRQLGFEKAVAQVKGATCKTVIDPTFGQRSKEYARELLSVSPRPTAVFCANDFQAASVYAVASEMGLQIPRDLSVVGFADLSLASYLHPTLTTVAQNPGEIGRLAARLLADRISGRLTQTEPQKVRLKPELIVRASTAPIDPGNR